MRHVYAIFAVTFLLATANSSASEQTINGKIKAVDAGKNSITVDDVVLDVSRKTKITVDGKKATLADINPGQQAIVTYDDSLEAAITIAIGDEDKDQVVLFNANDLEGWKFVVAPKFKDQAHLTVLECWGVDADRAVLFSNGKGPTWLATEPNYDNFTLSLEWRFPPNTQPSPNGSGIVVRANGVHSFECDPRGIEIDISEANTGDFVCYGTPLNAKKKAAGETTQSLGRMADPDLKPSGQWNNMEIRCDGEKISVKVNGKSVNEGAGARVKKGEICLRSQNTAIEFRKIKLTPSKSESK